MWKKLKDTDYFLLVSYNLEVYVTDYISLWFLHFTDSTFLTCLKKSNFGLEMDETELLEMGKNMLRNPESLSNIIVCKEDTLLKVSLITTSNIPLMIKMILLEGSKEMFFQKVTQQLLCVIQDLHSSQKALRKLLIKKDEEIEEYKCEGGEIALRHLKTIPFNEKEHLAQHTILESQFQLGNIPESLLRKKIDVPDAVKVEVKHESEGTYINGASSETKSKSKQDNSKTVVKMESVTDNVEIEPNTSQGTSFVNGRETQLNMMTEAGKSELVTKREIKSESNSQSARPSPQKRKKFKLNF